jgi:hypothetical protein
MPVLGCSIQSVLVLYQDRQKKLSFLVPLKKAFLESTSKEPLNDTVQKLYTIVKLSLSLSQMILSVRS